LKNVRRQTPLLAAELCGREEAARILRRNGATLEFKDMKSAGRQYPLDKVCIEGPLSNRAIERKMDLKSLNFDCVSASCQSALYITYFCQPDDALTKYQKEHQIKLQEPSFT
jgi:hypothetical protein